MQYEEVKDRFQLTAQPDILYKEGFLPTKRDTTDSSNTNTDEIDRKVSGRVRFKPVSIEQQSSGSSLLDNHTFQESLNIMNDNTNNS